MYDFSFKQETAYAISDGDGSSDVCSSDLNSPQNGMLDRSMKMDVRLNRLVARKVIVFVKLIIVWRFYKITKIYLIQWLN